MTFYNVRWRLRPCLLFDLYQQVPPFHQSCRKPGFLHVWHADSAAGFLNHHLLPCVLVIELQRTNCGTCAWGYSSFRKDLRFPSFSCKAEDNFWIQEVCWYPNIVHLLFRNRWRLLFLIFRVLSPGKQRSFYDPKDPSSGSCMRSLV